jgi:hypothetical protein
MRRVFLLLLLGITCVYALDMPELESKAPSVRLRLAGVGDDLYMVWLDNLSSQPLTAFRIFGPTREGYHFLIGGQSTAANPVVASGKSEQFGPFHRDQSKVVLEAVLFADHSYEGNPEVASVLAAGQVGMRIRLEQIREIVSGVLQGQDLADPAKADLVGKGIAALPDEVTPEMMLRVRSEFPNLSLTDEMETAELKSALHAEKDLVMQNFQRFPGNAEGKTLEQYWKKLDRLME